MKNMHYFNHWFKGLLICMGAPFGLFAQVTINAGIPAGGMIQKEQLWNLTLINNYADILEVNIKLTLQDVLTGQEVMSANTGSLPLYKGVKILSQAELQPILYHFNTASLSGNFLPVGNYMACYQVSHTRGEFEEALSNECVQFTIDPLSPPLLITPGDKDSLQTPYPVFTWMPPAPVEMFSDLNYDIVVNEVLNGQSPAEAIESNTPVYVHSNTMRPNEIYPSSFAPLEPGKIYAWQVMAKTASGYAAKTEVWTFTLMKKPEPVSFTHNNFYLLLENYLKDTYSLSEKQIHLKYASFDIEHEGTVIFSDAKHNTVMTVKKKIVQGDNYFDIDLNNRFQKGLPYIVSIIDMHGDSRAILFSIKK